MTLCKVQIYLAAVLLENRAALANILDCCRKFLSGRSIAVLGEANIKGVPALGLPKMSNFVGFISSPTFSASPL
jgi:hypothetical protein